MAKRNGLSVEEKSGYLAVSSSDGRPLFTISAGSRPCRLRLARAGGVTLQEIEWVTLEQIFRREGGAE